LIGFFRNKEKYLVINSINPESAVPPAPREGL